MQRSKDKSKAGVQSDVMRCDAMQLRMCLDLTMVKEGEVLLCAFALLIYDSRTL